MAKDQSFAAKVAKGAASAQGHDCPTCGEKLEIVQLVVSEKVENKEVWKFNQRFVPVCKCNQAEVYG